MKTGRRLTREIIVQTIRDTLEPLDHVHAMWEGGAAAFSRIDQWSDIDLYLAVDDDKVNETFPIVEQALTSLSPIEQKCEIPSLPWPGLAQAFYKLRGTSEYLIIDLVIMKLSSPDKLLEPEIHGKALFYLNKSNCVKTPSLDKSLFTNRLRDRLERTDRRISIFSSFVQKEINRGNYLEAIDLYHNLVLSALIEVLRIRYGPLHYDFKLRYIHYELPQQIVEELKDLYFVKDERDLQRKYHKAISWFRRALSDVDRIGLENLLSTQSELKLASDSR